MTHILHRQIDHRYPSAVRGSRIVLRDADGKEYIDASGGAAVSCLGHSHPDVLAAMLAQLDALEYAHTSFFTTPLAEVGRRSGSARAGRHRACVLRQRRLGGDRGGA
jgi:adenosylmethionine-8-amino-7-oxononanoate aminotransferase